jgi:hypothetical protein
MNLQTYTLPEFWACALINADTSGMSDEDEAALDAWFDATFPHGAHCLDCGEEASFTRWHDASAYVLACDCVEFTFDVLAVG